jgi:putative membrane protein
MPERSDPPPRFDAAGDATRRTWLANERTWLAWLRTGLAATGLALAVGKVLPVVGKTGHDWAYEALGAGYGVLGVLLVAYGFRRRSDVEDAVARGRYRSPAPAVIALFTALSAVLGVASVVLLLAG